MAIINPKKLRHIASLREAISAQQQRSPSQGTAQGPVSPAAAAASSQAQAPGAPAPSVDLTEAPRPQGRGIVPEHAGKVGRGLGEQATSGAGHRLASLADFVAKGRGKSGGKGKPQQVPQRLLSLRRSALQRPLTKSLKRSRTGARRRKAPRSRYSA